MNAPSATHPTPAEARIALRGMLHYRGQGEANFVRPDPATTPLVATQAGLELRLSDALRELAWQRRRGLVVLGPPGAGKSDYLTGLLADFAARGSAATGGFVPIAVPLIEAARRGLGATLAELAADAPPRLFLLDGLDQIADADARRALVVQVREAAAALPACRVVLTSRLDAYVSDEVMDAQFLEIQICPLRRAEAEDLLRRRGADALLRELRPGHDPRVRSPLAAVALCRLRADGEAIPADLAALARARVPAALAGPLDALVRWHGAARPAATAAAMQFVPVPAGSFLMGSPDDEPGRWADEGPVHRVDVAAFHLGRTPVSNAEYAAFLAAHPEIEPPPTWDDPRFDDPLQPVVGVTWDDARRFAAWIGGRLPSEAEWEYACRAGGGGARPGPLDEIAWHLANSGGAPPRVGLRAANAWGLHDILGTVWEWVEDDHHPGFDGAPVDGRPWIDAPRGTRHILKGGSWADQPRVLRSATRLNNHPGPRIANVGFRVARSAEPAT